MRGRAHVGQVERYMRVVKVGMGIEKNDRESKFESARYMRRLLGEETKCDRAWMLILTGADL
jgi:hypothetical protein